VLNKGRPTNCIVLLDNSGVGCGTDQAEDGKRQKVVVLRELERAIIYTAKMSKQMMKSHVIDAVHMYLVN
jgi:hypothetical protein